MIVLALLWWSWGLGWGLTQTLASEPAPLMAPKPQPTTIQPVDPIPTRYEPGFETYLETCGTCHIALPPEIMPTESWQEILRRPDKHFGVSITNIERVSQFLIWDYLSTFSRPLPPNNTTPLFAERSPYFKALHPRVSLPPDMTAKSCVLCHPQVGQFDFRTLTPEWENSP